MNDDEGQWREGDVFLYEMGSRILTAQQRLPILRRKKFLFHALTFLNR